MKTTVGTVTMPSMSGKYIGDVRLLGEPTPVVGTNLFRCLADVAGALCLVELKLTFAERDSLALAPIGEMG